MTTNIIKGTKNAEYLKGTSGDDLFIGGGGNDTFYGNYGNDTVDFSWSNSGINVNLSIPLLQNSGNGKVVLSNIKNLIGTNYDDHLFGYIGNNTLDGLGGDDSLFGDSGFDILFGRDGNDTLNGGSDADTLYGDAGDDSLVGGEERNYDANDLVYGGSGYDTILGGAGNDTLYGESGNDLLIGGSGADYMNGGLGFDIVSYRYASAQVSVDLRASSGYFFKGEAAGDYFNAIEAVEGSYYGDTFYSNNEAITFFGGHGEDSLVGGSGNDSLYGDHDGIPIYASWENNDTISGGGGSDSISGEDGNDSLTGGAGADTIDGGPGMDTASYQDAPTGVNINTATPVGAPPNYGTNDKLINIEIIIGSNYADNILGDAGNNSLRGLNGNDTLNGGSGADILTGGTGADYFVFKPGEVVSGEEITDFNHAQGDEIDLSAIDANAKTAANDVFSFIHANAFSHVAGQLHYVVKGANIIVEGDTNGDGFADFAIKLDNNISVTAADFVL